VTDGELEPVAHHLRWAKGGHAQITKTEGDAIELRSTTPAPPGAPLEATLESAPATKVTIKSHGTRRDGDVFILSGRLISATRELRERLAALAAATSR
jgi:hypothetical protein